MVGAILLKMGAVCWEQCGGWNTNDLMGLVEAIVDSYRDTSPPMLRVDKSSGKCSRMAPSQCSV